MMEKSLGTGVGKRVGISAGLVLVLMLAAGMLMFSACDNPVFGKLVNEQALFGKWNNPSFMSDYWPKSKYWDLDSLGSLEYVDITNSYQPQTLPYLIEGSWEEGEYHYSKIKVLYPMTTYYFLIRMSADYKSLEMNYSTTGIYPSSIIIEPSYYIKLDR